jgi:hypothetical protein
VACGLINSGTEASISVLVDSIYASQTAGYPGNSSDHEVRSGLTVNLNPQKGLALI